MPIAAPLLVPFAELVGITTAGLALSQVSDAVQSYMKANPEQSMKILTMLSPELGIASMMKKKTTKPKVEVEVEDEEEKLTAKEKNERFKELAKTPGRGRQDFIDLAKKLGLAKKGSEEQPPEDDDEEEKILTGAQKTQLFKNLFKEGGERMDFARLGRATKRGNEGLYQEGLEALKKTLKGKKDGGRIGYAIGGLTDRAQGIYSSMLNAGFGEQAIIDTLNQMGLYNQTPAVATPEVVNTQPNIINQQMDRGGGDGTTTPPAVDPYSGLGYSSANFGLSANPLDGSNVMDYEADAYEQGRTFTGQLNKIGLGIFSALKNIPTPFNIVRMGIQKAQEIARQEEIEREAQQAAIARDIARENEKAGTGGYQAGYSSDFMGGPSGAGYGMGAGDKGGSDTMGSFANGGLAIFFGKK